jgi:hypothetical protein
MKGIIFLTQSETGESCPHRASPSQLQGKYLQPSYLQIPEVAMVAAVRPTLQISGPHVPGFHGNLLPRPLLDPPVDPAIATGDGDSAQVFAKQPAQAG